MSFLTHFYPKLFRLPGIQVPYPELRWSLAMFLRDFPTSLANPIASLNKFREEHKEPNAVYEGDLEADFLRFLGEVHRLANQEPVEIHIDFR